MSIKGYASVHCWAVTTKSPEPDQHTLVGSVPLVVAAPLSPTTNGVPQNGHAVACSNWRRPTRQPPISTDNQLRFHPRWRRRGPNAPLSPGEPPAVCQPDTSPQTHARRGHPPTPLRPAPRGAALGPSTPTTLSANSNPVRAPPPSAGDGTAGRVSVTATAPMRWSPASRPRPPPPPPITP